MCALLGLNLSAQQAALKFQTSFVDDSGQVKPLHGIHGGPLSTNSLDPDLTEHYKNAGIPFVRFPYGDGFADEFKPVVKEGQTAVSKVLTKLTLGDIFPDSDADPNDEKKYDFSDIDKYVKSIKSSGAEPIWQVIFDIGKGSSAWLDNGKQVGKSPQDIMKWNAVVINVLRHFNNSWAKGGRWGVKYIEFLYDPSGFGGYDFRFEDRNVRMGRIGDAKPGRAQFLNDYVEFIRTVERYNSNFGGNVKVLGPGLDAEQTIRFIPEFMNKIAAVKVNPSLVIFTYKDYNTPQKIFENASFIRKEIDRLVLGNYRGIPLWCTEWNWSSYYSPLQDSKNISSAQVSAWIMSHHIQTMTLAQPYWDASIIYRGNREAPSQPLPSLNNSYYFDFNNKVSVKPAYFALAAMNKIYKETPVRLPVKGGTKENLITLFAAKSANSKKLILLLSFWKERAESVPAMIRYSVDVSNFQFNEGQRGKLYIIDKNTKSLQPVKEIIPTMGRNGEMSITEDISLWSAQIIEFER